MARVVGLTEPLPLEQALALALKSAVSVRLDVPLTEPLPLEQVLALALKIIVLVGLTVALKLVLLVRLSVPLKLGDWEKDPDTVALPSMSGKVPCRRRLGACVRCALLTRTSPPRHALPDEGRKPTSSRTVAGRSAAACASTPAARLPSRRKNTKGIALAANRRGLRSNINPIRGDTATGDTASSKSY